MPIHDNLGEIEGWLDGALDEIGWDMPGADGTGTLASAFIDVIIDGQQARAMFQQGLDGDWADNASEYRKGKEKLYGDSPPNFRTKQMLSRESMRGTSEVGRDTAEWTYGTGTAPGGGRTRRDRTTTDTEKARYAHEGQSEKNIVREFFGLIDEDVDQAMPAVEDAIAAHLERRATQP